MIKLFLEITRNNLFKSKKSERSHKGIKNFLSKRINSTQNFEYFLQVISRNYLDFEEIYEETEGKRT
jgi:hypothetical protein